MAWGLDVVVVVVVVVVVGNLAQGQHLRNFFLPREPYLEYCSGSVVAESQADVAGGIVEAGSVAEVVSETEVGCLPGGMSFEDRTEAGLGPSYGPGAWDSGSHREEQPDKWRGGSCFVGVVDRLKRRLRASESTFLQPFHQACAAKTHQTGD